MLNLVVCMLLRNEGLIRVSLTFIYFLRAFSVKVSCFLTFLVLVKELVEAFCKKISLCLVSWNWNARIKLGYNSWLKCVSKCFSWYGKFLYLINQCCELANKSDHGSDEKDTNFISLLFVGFVMQRKQKLYLRSFNTNFLRLPKASTIL